MNVPMSFIRRKPQKSICFLLIICLLFLGMCSERVQADSSFSCSDETAFHTDSSLRSVEKSILTDQLYVQETLTRESGITGLRQAVRRVFARTYRGAALSLILADILPPISHIITASNDCELSAEPSSNTIIVSFIHHKDGKKS